MALAKTSHIKFHLTILLITFINSVNYNNIEFLFNKVLTAHIFTYQSMQIVLPIPSSEYLTPKIQMHLNTALYGPVCSISVQILTKG